MEKPVCGGACKGRRHIRQEDGRWRRCVCASGLLVKPSIRRDEDAFPPVYATKPALPLKDLTLGGDFTAFRYHVWRSLLDYGELLYDYMDAYRLVEIHFAQDTLYARVRDLETLDLVIVALGVADLPNKFIGPLMCQLLTLRRNLGRPTWVYVQFPDRVAQAYGSELDNLLKPALRHVVGTGHRVDPTQI